jgi:hypothetical protein
VKRDELTEFDGELLDGLQFCCRVYALYESIRNAPDGPSRFRRRPSRVEKRLLGELLPICTYVQASYRPGRYISVRWIDGPQTYDAEVEQRGAYVSDNFYPGKAFLEVTSAMHPNDFLGRELLEKEGFAFGNNGLRRLKDRSIESVPVSYRNREFVEEFCKFILEQVEAKEKKAYPANTTLIVQCMLNLPYSSDEWSDLVGRVEEALPPSRFREICLFDSMRRFSHTVIPKERPHSTPPV